MDVLSVVPSTQLDPSQTLLRRSVRRYSDRRPGRSQLLAPASAPPPIPWSQDSEPTVGRGILRLRAPPKLARTPASRRRPPPCTVVPLPQWTIEVPPSIPLTPDIFQDANVDYRPLTGTWDDIVQREEQAASASALATSVGAAMASSSAEIPPVAGSNLDRLTVTSLSSASTFTGTAVSALIPAVVATAALDTPVTSTIPAVALEAPLGGPSSTGIVYQVGYRPVLRLADIAYTVRMSWIEQSDRIVDMLFDRFQTNRSRDQVLLIVQAMFASLRDVGAYLRERVVHA